MSDVDTAEKALAQSSITVYTVTVGGEQAHKGRSLTEAIRAWDAATYSRLRCPGGISVQSWDSRGNMVRDGWILHLREDGTTYLNPNLREG